MVGGLGFYVTAQNQSLLGVAVLPFMACNADLVQESLYYHVSCRTLLQRACQPDIQLHNRMLEFHDRIGPVPIHPSRYRVHMKPRMPPPSTLARRLKACTSRATALTSFGAPASTIASQQLSLPLPREA